MIFVRKFEKVIPNL